VEFGEWLGEKMIEGLGDLTGPLLKATSILDILTFIVITGTGKTISGQPDLH
jgi:hypothetical protein